MTDGGDVGPEPARLILSEVHPGHVEVHIQPPWRAEYADLLGVPRSAERPSASLMMVDATKCTVVITPRVTSPSRRFLKPKHAPVTELALEGWNFLLPETEDQVRQFLLALPAGFINTPEFGLGIEKEFLPILSVVGRLPGVTCLALTNRRATGQDESIFFLTYRDYDNVRRGMRRVTSRYRAEARADRTILAHNEILTALDPVRFPEAKRPYAPGTVFKLLSRRAETARLSNDDGTALVRTLKAAAPVLANKPEQLFALGKTVERVGLELVIQRFEALLAKGGSEARWQRLLDQNPFILTLVFGYPIVTLASQGLVGGWRMTGGGAKIADYVVKNQMTHAVALVELKTPATDLTTADYRKGVPGVSAKLTGAVMQVLDQRHKLQRSLHLLKDEDETLRDAQAYGIDCIVVAGLTPTDPAKIKSFELFRSGLRDVRIFTFDEIAEKLKALLAVLIAEPQVLPAPADDATPARTDAEATAPMTKRRRGRA